MAYGNAPTLQQNTTLVSAYEKLLQTFPQNARACGVKQGTMKKELDTSAFVLPKLNVKNNRSRVIVLKQISRECIESQLRKHPESVFTYRGKPVDKLNISGGMNSIDLLCPNEAGSLAAI